MTMKETNSLRVDEPTAVTESTLTHGQELAAVQVIPTEDEELIRDNNPQMEIQHEIMHTSDKDTETQVTDVDDEEETELVQPSNYQLLTNSAPREKFVFDPSKLYVRFLFANHDGLDVTVVCKPSDTVAQLKGQLLSLWPNQIQPGSSLSGEQLRLICMGKGLLGPDPRTLSECGIPIFETHATPINVSVRPMQLLSGDSSEMKKNDVNPRVEHQIPSQTSSDACCVIL